MGKIKNYNEIAVTENRKQALSIIEAGLASIDTFDVVREKITLDGEVLSVMGQSFDLSVFEKIKVVGFGKASGEATQELEKILGDRISVGAVIDIDETKCEKVETFIGTHPTPSMQNVKASERIYEILAESTERDLVIVVASGGGSSLLCYPESEMEQGKKLFEEFLKTGGDIQELNTIRKHLSVFKGGGLAKIAYPATVIGLIFSDVPGDHYESVASGGTYKDTGGVKDAEEIIKKYNLSQYDLVETPKEDKYFENVHNFVLVSNIIAVERMAQKGKELGFATRIISIEMYDDVSVVVSGMFDALGFGNGQDELVICAGEPGILVSKKGGMGGRNLHMNLLALDEKFLNEKRVFIAFASDGIDNSKAMGAVADRVTLANFKDKKINREEYLDNFDSYNAFLKSGDLIMTGPTGSNVADLIILLNKK